MSEVGMGYGLFKKSSVGVARRLVKSALVGRAATGVESQIYCWYALCAVRVVRRSAFGNSDSCQARAVRVRTLPCAPSVQREFGDVVTVRRINDDQKVGIARCQKKLFDLNSDKRPASDTNFR